MIFIYFGEIKNSPLFYREMPKKDKLFQNILLFALVFLMAYSLGLSVVNLINNRLENISIKVPPVNVAAPQVNIQYDPETKTLRAVPVQDKSDEYEPYNAHVLDETGLKGAPIIQMGGSGIHQKRDHAAKRREDGSSIHLMVGGESTRVSKRPNMVGGEPTLAVKRREDVSSRHLMVGGGHLLGLKATPNRSPLPPTPTCDTIKPHAGCVGFRKTQSESACHGKGEATVRGEMSSCTECGAMSVGDCTCKARYPNTFDVPPRPLTSPKTCKLGHSPRDPEHEPNLTGEAPRSSDEVLGAGSSDGAVHLAKKGCADRLTGQCTNDDQCNQVYGRGANKCQNGRCTCRYGAGDYCQEKPTYYLDPRMMTPQQVVKFKNRAKLENMTMQDYKNWLGLFDSDLEDLPLVHRKNFWRLQRGDVIKFIPLDSADTDPSNMHSNYRNDDSGTCNATSDTLKQESSSHTGGTVQTSSSSSQAGGSVVLTPDAVGGRGPGGQPAGMPDDERLYRTWGGRKLAPAGINPTTDDLVEVNLRLPAVEVDTSNNYRLTDNHLNTAGYIDQRNETATPLQWSNYADAFEPNRKYVEYNNKVTPFKTTLVTSWYQNRAPELSDLVESTYFDPRFRCV